MEFRTPVPVLNRGFHLDYGQNWLGIGSCFAEEIGRQLKRAKFRVQLNPFGILYDPFSIGRGIQRLLDYRTIDPGELFLHQGLWRHFDFHSRFADPDREQAQARMDASILRSSLFLAQTNILILTLGTAYYYKDGENKVANCHKLPAARFTKHKAGVNEIIDALSTPLQSLFEARPDIRILLTVSPVRHLREGIVENQRSKAALVLAAEQMEKNWANLVYFPAYELLIDDLRDYRFYDTDMVHPNEPAISYIWDYFQQCFFDETTRGLIRRIERLGQAMSHRPFFPESEEHRQFLLAQVRQIAELQEAWPGLDFSEEMAYFSGGLGFRY